MRGGGRDRPGDLNQKMMVQLPARGPGGLAAAFHPSALTVDLCGSPSLLGQCENWGEGTKVTAPTYQGSILGGEY